MRKVVPGERLRREFGGVLAGVGEEQDPIEVVARLGARLILQQALEDGSASSWAAGARSAPTAAGRG